MDPLRAKDWDAPSGVPSPRPPALVYHAMSTENGPVPSVVTVMVAVAVVGPVCRKPVTVTPFTAGADGGLGEAVVGVAPVVGPLEVVSSTGATVADAGGSPGSAVTGAETEAESDGPGDALDDALEDGDAEGSADVVGAVDIAGPAAAWALLVASACAACCGAASGACRRL
ncbi:hypothetical protein QFZ56_000243 [Streptomyces achromogenes]|uniref:Uncharacterized protein n=1 Tax=Streptomyces achromogenes TaxID=67255 RepID=A0ABU0PSC5_STRAH|nr:hypothetical protein [Streptomyces achromogenes]MDQ0681280.1 hypothetical protein [Streptomyces achromogenes]